ncbi:hypothetical protein NMG60_11015672 [Bertholletia excelsa]
MRFVVVALLLTTLVASSCMAAKHRKSLLTVVETPEQGRWRLVNTQSNQYSRLNHHDHRGIPDRHVDGGHI